MSAIDQRNKYCGTVTRKSDSAGGHSHGVERERPESFQRASGDFINFKVLVCMSQGHTRVGGLLLRVVDTGHWTLDTAGEQYTPGIDRRRGKLLASSTCFQGLSPGLTGLLD